MPADLNDYFKKKMNDENEPKNPKPNNNNKIPKQIKDFGNKSFLLYIFIALFVVMFVAKPYKIVNSGEVGIKVTTGTFAPKPLQNGIHFYVPAIQKIIIVDTKVRIITYKTGPDVSVSARTRYAMNDDSGIQFRPAISVLDSRGLPVAIELTVQYRLKPDGAPQTIATWGLDWEEKIINPVVRNIVRNAIGNYKAEELPINRNAIAKIIAEEIRAEIDNLPNRPVELSSVQLRDIVLPQKIRDQIERVQIAKQEGDRVKLEVEKAKQEAERVAAEARGRAEAKKIKAEAEAKKIMIEAKAQAEANIEIAKSITPALLQLKQIEVQGKFNEALQVNKDAKIFLTPNGAVPNIWVDTKDKPKTTVSNN